MRPDLPLKSERGCSPRRPRCAAIVLGTIVSLLCFVTPALADNTGVSGAVTDHTTGQPLAQVQVNVLDAATGQLVNSTCTDGGGQYTFGGLPPGSYLVGFESTAGDFRVCGGRTNYLPQFWQGATTPAAARAVNVPAGTTVFGINAAMDPGGAITGTVTDATDGKAAPGVEVDAFDGAGSLVSSTCTESDGSYALFALATGDYRVEYLNTSTCGSGTPFRSQYYSGQSSLAAADPIHVLVTQTTPGINAALIPKSARTLTVTFAGAGAGTVQFNPYAAFCTRTCVLPLTGTQTVTLTAAPGSGSTFAGWSGNGCSGTWTCTVKAGSDAAVIATFGRVGSAGGSGGSGGAGGAPGIGAGAGGGHTAPTCSATAVSARIRMARPATPRPRGPRARRARARPAVPTLSLRYRCDQAVRLAESAVARVTTQVRASHAARARTRIRTIRMGDHAWSTPAGTGILTLTVPLSVLRAARTRASVSVAFRLAYGNARGSATATAVIARLRAS